MFHRLIILATAYVVATAPALAEPNCVAIMRVAGFFMKGVAVCSNMQWLSRPMIEREIEPSANCLKRLGGDKALGFMGEGEALFFRAVENSGKASACAFLDGLLSTQD